VIIDSVATRRGAALVDLNGLLRTAATRGLPYQGTLYDDAFITGGLFGSMACIPPISDMDSMANTMIDAVNAKFGSSIPRVNLSEVATLSRYAVRRADGSSGRPWSWAWRRVAGPLREPGPADPEHELERIGAARIGVHRTRRR